MDHLLVERAPLDVELGARAGKLAFGALQPSRCVEPGRKSADDDSEGKGEYEHRADER